MYMDDFSSALLTRILEEGRDRLTDFQDVSDDMAARIWSAKDQYPRFDALAAAVKTRTWTRTRVDRALTHILLGIRKSAYTPPSFVRVLGFAASFEPYLSEMSRRFPGTLILRTSRDAKALSESERARFEEDLRASELYRSVRMIKYPGADLKPERSRGVIIL